MSSHLKLSLIRVMDAENKEISNSRKLGVKFIPNILENGDTKRQLLARSRYALFKI